MRVKIYVISLSDAQQRRDHVWSQLAGAELPWEIVDAVRAEDRLVQQMLEESRKSSKWHKSLRAGEVACYMSHVRVWQKMLDEGVESALILEDDFQLKKPVDEIVRILLGFQSEYDMIKLFGTPRKSRCLEKRAADGQSYELHQAFSIKGITVAQWVRATAVPRLIAKAQKMERPIDMDFKHHWEYPMKIYHLIPAMVDEVSAQLGGSSIGQRKTKKTGKQLLKRWAAKCQYYGNCIKHYYF
jgi:glycosyl transferase family 25